MTFSQQPARCPSCRADLVRVHRTQLDVMISQIVPVVRLRCRTAGCGWERREITGSDPRAQRLRAGILALIVLLLGAGASIVLSTLPAGRPDAKSQRR